MMSNLTPMMQQYKQIKQQYPEAILFFRLGDFYEMFFDDAVTASDVLQITLTSRNKEGGKDGKKVPMCGVPHHAANGYIAKLIQNGYKVAVCEQVEDPQEAKGIVRREVIRVITPATFLEGEDDGNCFLAVLTSANKEAYGLAAIDIRTGEFIATFLSGGFTAQRLTDELMRLNPAEILLVDDTVLPDSCCKFKNIASAYIIEDYELLHGRIMKDFCFMAENKAVCSNQLLLNACAAGLDYLEKTQKRILSHLTAVRVYSDNSYMLLDAATRSNLELTESLTGKSNQGTLFWLLNFTKTAMGKRTLRQWIEQPLIDCQQITDRQETVTKLTADIYLRENLKAILQKIYDLERIAGKISYGSVNPRDLIALKNSLQPLPELKQLLLDSATTVFGNYGAILDTLEDIYELIDRALIEEPPVSIKDGGIIKDEYNAQIAELRSAKHNGKQWIARMENEERNKTGIKSLKVSYNKVFGYYLEVTNSNLSMVPDHYMRKQTLANCERYITPQLKEFENIILGADDKLVKLEYNEFIALRDKINADISRLQNTALLIGRIDAAYSLAEAAIAGSFVCPQVDNSDRIEIINGRHPVVEKMLATGDYIANDCLLDKKDNMILLITGANMTGKSTYMRQVALIVLMAQIGSFVPAAQAHIGVVDRIFTRVGASDNLVGGQSTFMVEMKECQNILLNATAQSLIIMDEVGRGTSTYDGISIARAITEYIYHHIKAKTLFSTHYHELTEMDKYPGICNYTIAVKEDGENIIFLRKVIAGKADKSYGIHVARLAGLPEEVINKANGYLAVYENNSAAEAEKSTDQPAQSLKEDNKINSAAAESKPSTAEITPSPGEYQLSWLLPEEQNNSAQLPEKNDCQVNSKILEELRKVNINRITPLKALNMINNWQEKLSSGKYR